jgi:hypothetical protein
MTVDLDAIFVDYATNLADCPLSQEANFVDLHLEEHLSQVLKSKGSRTDEELKRLLGEEVGSILSNLAHQTALKFDRSEISFEMADAIANDVWQLLMTHDRYDQIPRNHVVIVSEVYEAFDAGEHTHFGRYPNPVEQMTIPLVKEYLSKQASF